MYHAQRVRLLTVLRFREAPADEILSMVKKDPTGSAGGNLKQSRLEQVRREDKDQRRPTRNMDFDDPKNSVLKEAYGT